jgi:8-oxo-dGTP pyrophosphatase MutT (NUDIX family)
MNILDKIKFANEASNDYIIWTVYNDRRTSAGILFTDGERFLAVHPTGSSPNYWDLPKGNVDEGEQTDDAAVREFHEEVGITVNKSDLKLLGKVSLIGKKKDVHIYIHTLDKLPSTSTMNCSSETTIKGKMLPEIDGYKYFKFEDYKKIRKDFHGLLAKLIKKV